MIDENLFKDYLERHYKESKRTLFQYARCFRNYKRIADEINQAGVDTYFQKYSNTGQNRAFIKCLIASHKVREYIDIPVPKTRTKEKIIQYLTKEERDHIVAHAKSKIGIAVALAWDTGIRLSELVCLKKGDIDLVNRQINGIGKGNKEFKLNFSKQTALKLISYLDSIETDYPFQTNNVLHQEKKFGYEFKKECKRLGIKNAHFHMVRHGVGRHLRKDHKLDLEVVRYRLRHKSIATTQRYTEATDIEVKDVMESIFNKEKEE